MISGLCSIKGGVRAVSLLQTQAFHAEQRQRSDAPRPPRSPQRSLTRCVFSSPRLQTALGRPQQRSRTTADSISHHPLGRLHD